jgi:2,5-diketo-D-gluconate reductase B
MQTITAGGAVIPALGFGVFRMTGEEVARMVPHALSAGFRHFDTAQIYRNEADLGRALQKAGVKREELFITTKIWTTNYAPDRFAASLDESLEKLRMDHVDLLLLHWPNDAVPLVDQIAGLDAAKAAGKTRHIGVSNFTIAMVEKSISLAQAPIVTNQVEIHPYIDQSTLLTAMKSAGVSATAYYGMADGKVISDPVIRAIGDAHGKSAAQVVLRWLIQQGLVALSKTANPARAAENFAIFDFALSDGEMARIHELVRADGRLVSPAGLAPQWDH